MPRKIIDYSKIMMYKIVSNDLNIRECYVGSTTEFTKRKYNHKSSCTNVNGKKYNLKVYQFIRDNGDWHNWSMVLIEMFLCTNHLESLQRERYWCEHLNTTLNSLVPSRSQKEYIVANIDHITDQQKQYREANREHIREQKKQYREEHMEKIKYRKNTVLICQCGCSYTRANKSQHIRSEKHKEYVNNRLYYDIQRGLNMIKVLDKHLPTYI
jgi:hypothetical protein